MPTRANALAADLTRALLQDQLEHLTALGDVDLYVAFTPVDAASLVRSMVPARFQCFCQRGESLGERMKEVFAELWRRGHKRLVLIGSDLPAVPLNFFHDAYTVLNCEDKRVVFGPVKTAVTT